jgi:uncharacterized protein (TIGR02246 family)
MRRAGLAPALAVVIAMAAAPDTANAGASAAAESEAAIRGLISTYARAVDEADVNLAATVWSTTPDTSFIHPRGHEHGWEAVKGFYEKAMGETFSERKLTVRDVVVHAYGDSAWAEFYWDFVAKMRKDGTPLTTHGRETQIYRKRSGRWSLVHVHYSGMPVVEERQGF